MKKCIREALISTPPQRSEKGKSDELSREERDEIGEQLDALGYTD
ncbi:hypothetical protein [Haladaptatus sp. DYF46]|nr:hypothetical protein [Haladaptatus sp. DYF46]